MGLASEFIVTDSATSAGNREYLSTELNLYVVCPSCDLIHLYLLIAGLVCMKTRDNGRLSRSSIRRLQRPEYLAE